MRQIPFIKSLMEFDKRVLWQGNISSEKKYAINELKDKLFFNKIFMSNTQEIFQKYNTSPIIEDYIEGVTQYISNVNKIIAAITKEKDSIRISREDSFERRLSIEGKIPDQIISKVFHKNDTIEYKFLNNHLYYLSLFDNENIMISYIDMRSAIYQEVINCQMDGYKLYWKTDDCIRDYIRDKYHSIDTIAIRITASMNKSNAVTKVEYNGSTEIMKLMISLFPSKALILSNPFIYVDDINTILKQNMDIKPPVSIPVFDSNDLEDLINHDRLIEYPNDSFDEYLQFISLASKSKDVKAIYMTLYRIGKDPAIFYILRDAALKGIKVYVNIELFASGESINKLWMNEMCKVGINVNTYAAGKLKIHCKMTLVEFVNGKSIAQIGTGNYHTQTTSQYTDLSLITSDDDICKQVKKVFDLFRGKRCSDEVSFNKNLLVTRYNCKDELIRLIDEEGSKGSNGYIMIKCNSIDDKEIIYHLDNAANNGCIIDLVVRGVCTWIPRPGTSVIIKSIVWDKLEHSRVFCFGRYDPTIYIGSLDLVTKKLNQRIETLVLIKDPEIAIQLCNYLNRYITNSADAWIQTSSGMYIKE